MPAALAVGVLTGAAQESVSSLLGDESWSWPAMAARTSVTAVGWLLAWWLAHEALGRGWISPGPARRRDEERRQLLGPVLLSGRLPEGTEPRAWRRPLRDEARLLGTVCWLWWLLSASVAGLTATAAVVADDNAWPVWAVALAVAVQGVLLPRGPARKRRTARRLLAELGTARAG